MSAALETALAPLLERAKRRADRLKKLQADPPSPERDRAVAAEQRELEVVRTTVTNVEALFGQTRQRTSLAAATAAHAKTQLLEVVTEASHYENLFLRTLQLPVGDPPDEKWPDVARRAQLAMFRMNHIRTSPDTYAATFGLSTNP